MTLPIALVLALVALAAVLLVTERLRPDLVAMLLLVSLGLTGLVSAKDLFSGFSRSAVITIIALYIITHGLERTGATRILGRYLYRLAGSNETRAVLVLMVAVALLSLVMNTVAAAAVLLPAAIGITRQTELRPSRLLIPLSFGSLLGGMATLFTTANIIVSGVLSENGVSPYGVLDFVSMGTPMAVAGILFVAFVGRRFLPQHGLGGAKEAPRRPQSLMHLYGLDQAVCQAYVKPGSPLAGLSIADGGWGARLGLNVVGVSRGGHVHLQPSQQEMIMPGDVVLFTGLMDEADLQQNGLIPTHDPTWQGTLASDQISLLEVTLAPRSPLAGKTLREIHFREKYDCWALAIWREGQTIREALAEIPLRFGDALLLQGLRSKFTVLRDDPAFLVLDEDVAEAGVSREAWLAVGITTAAVLASALDLLPIAEATFAAAALMLLTNCLSADEAYAAIEWKSVFLIAAMLPLGAAMTNTGAAQLLGDVLTTALLRWGNLAVAGGLFLATVALTQIIGGQVAPAVLAPIAIAAARTTGADPRGMAMAVALGASTAFLSPVAHSTNLLVMGPGGYTFRDYGRVGLPLTLLLFVVFLIGLPVFWGIR